MVPYGDPKLCVSQESNSPISSWIVTIARRCEFLMGLNFIEIKIEK